MEFKGSLRPNEIFSGLFNMIISQQVFADNIAGVGAALVGKAKVDGGLYGDTKLYYATDVLKSVPWGGDAEAANLLALNRPDSPEVQAIVLDQFRQISLTVDNYLSKRAWSTPDAFSQFNSVMLGWLRETKRVYDAATYNAYIGTAAGVKGRQTITAPVSTAVSGLTGEEAAKVETAVIAETIADLITDLEDFSRDFNDYEFLRSYNAEDVKIVWNAHYYNKLRKTGLPTIFHKEGLVDKFEQDKLPARYFGDVILAGNIDDLSGTDKTLSSTGAYVPGKGTVRSMIETSVKVGENTYHVFPGQEIPEGATVGSGKQFELGEAYIEKADIVAKVVVKYPPFMSAFEVGTSFFNPKSLTENHYLTWGHNTIEYLKGYPMIKVVKA